MQAANKRENETVESQKLFEEQEEHKELEKHEEREKKLLRLRNIFVAIAGVLFIYSLVFSALHSSHMVRGFGYIFGAGAYITEMAMLTDGFKKKQPLSEMFMPYVFGILYIFMAIDYIF